MTLTASSSHIAKPSAPARELPVWAAASLAVTGNILVLGILAAAAVGVAVAAVLTFGSGLLAQL